MRHDLSHAGRRMLDRRAFLQCGGTGLGSVALAALLHEERLLAAEAIRPAIDPAAPHAPRPRLSSTFSSSIALTICGPVPM